MTGFGLSAIKWADFDWQSFSTLVTGVLAVAAAFFVGRWQSAIATRQADISERQSEILGMQVNLQEATLRADLFERRLLSFHDTSEFLLGLIGSEQEDDVFAASMTKFGQTMRESQFLFSNPEVHGRLRMIFDKANAIHMDRLLVRGEREIGGQIAPDVLCRLVEVGAWVMETLEELPSIFRKDLSIAGEDQG